MKAAHYWASYLKARGVRRVFGLPGTESIELVEALRRTGIEFFLTHHEATGAFIAAMCGQLTGVPGVCLATRGPGATNLTSGIATAHLDRMPLLAVAGDHAQSSGLPTHQRLPLVDFFAPITRASVRLSAASLPVDLPGAFDATVGDLPGPAFTAFPAPEAEKEVDAAPPTMPSETATARPVPDLGPVLAAIARSERAMILAGLGVPNGKVGQQLVRLAERLRCPIADTPQMKGWFPNDHPLYVGTFGTHRDQPVAALANASDLILAIGLDSVELLKPWKLAPPVVSLATAGADEPAIPAAIAVNGPLAEMLDGLAAEARPTGSWPSGTAERYRREILDGLVPPTTDEGIGLLWPQTVVAELQRALPDDGVVTADVGSHKLLLVLQWVARRPNSFLNSSGMSSMGTGIPFALAAKLTWPDRPVVAVVGDGGYLMYAGELETLARSGLPVVVVVMADSALYSIKIKQLRRSYPPVGTEFGSAKLSLTDVARDFGLQAVRVTDRAACAQALGDALRSDRPTVVVAVVDPSGYEYSQ